MHYHVILCAVSREVLCNQRLVNVFALLLHRACVQSSKPASALIVSVGGPVFMFLLHAGGRFPSISRSTQDHQDTATPGESPHCQTSRITFSRSNHQADMGSRGYECGYTCNLLILLTVAPLSLATGYQPKRANDDNFLKESPSLETGYVSFCLVSGLESQLTRSAICDTSCVSKGCCLQRPPSSLLKSQYR